MNCSIFLLVLTFTIKLIIINNNFYDFILSIIEIINNIVEKKFNNHNEAKYFKELYNNFPSHVKANIKRNSNILFYKYVPGLERKLIINENQELNEILCKNIGNILGKFHFSYLNNITDGYKKICINRGYIHDNNIFQSSKYYYGNIHGDLHLKNIIINKNKMYFIDRLKDKGDIMFDFSFIMSFLCLYFESNQPQYLKYIILFFKNYSKYIIGPEEDFFISFRDNFINYGKICYSISLSDKRFPERKHGETIVKSLIEERNFLFFIKKLLG